MAILTNYCYPSQKCKRRHVVSTWRIRWKTQPLRGHQSRPSSNRTPPHCLLPSHQLLLPAAWLKVTPARLKMPRTHLSAVQESPYPRDISKSPWMADTADSTCLHQLHQLCGDVTAASSSADAASPVIFLFFSPNLSLNLCNHPTGRKWLGVTRFRGSCAEVLTEAPCVLAHPHCCQLEHAFCSCPPPSNSVPFPSSLGTSHAL